MRTALSVGVLQLAANLLSLFPLSLQAQVQPGTLATPTFRVTTRLVFLDVTVLDKKGHPVVKGLTKPGW